MAESSKAPLLPVLHNINPSIPRTASHLRCSVPSARTIYVAMGPAASAVILSALDMSDRGASKSMLAALAWVFIWWLTEAVPVPVTSMAPLYLFPLFGITSAEDVAKSYMNDVIALVLGSFILAIAVEHYKIHQRLALNITLLFCGDPPNPSLILLGICGTTTFISFWMHNTAAAVMMVPVATGLLQRFPNDGEEGANRNVIGFCKAVVLGVIYSTSIGGIATLTGTGVNLITAGMWASYFPHERPISFSSWSMFALPLAVVMFLALWGILCFLYLSRNTGQALAIYFDKDHLKRELQLLGPMALAEKMVLSVFSFLVVLWMTRSITDQIPGWETLFELQIGDGTVSVLMATVLFVLPNMKGEGEKILDWNKCRKLQWNVILLLGAGFAIADGVRVSGLSDLLSDGLVFLRNVPPLAVAPLVCLLTATMTEFASNNATATLVAPLLIQLANTIGMHPLLLVLPGAIGAEFAFWLPTGTPPNAVGFATGRISIVDMLKVGVPLKFFGVAALGVLMPTLGTAVFGISK